MVELEEVGLVKVEEAESVGIMKITRPFDKKTEIHEEPSEEGGVFMWNRVGKSGLLLSIIVVRTTTAKRSAKKREAIRLPQVSMSSITPLTPNSKTTEACSS